MKAESGALFQQKERGGEGGRTEDMGPPEKVVQSKERINPWPTIRRVSKGVTKGSATHHKGEGRWTFDGVGTKRAEFQSQTTWKRKVNGKWIRRRVVTFVRSPPKDMVVEVETTVKKKLVPKDSKQLEVKYGEKLNRKWLNLLPPFPPGTQDLGDKTKVGIKVIPWLELARPGPKEGATPKKDMG
jgi:hypothetical protein